MNRDSTLLRKLITSSGIPAIATALALAAILVSYFMVLIDAPVLWRDEANNLAESRIEWRNFLSVNAFSTNGFSYAIILRFWSTLFGLSEISIRALSFLAVLISTTIIYRLGRTLGLPNYNALACVALSVLTPLTLQFYLGQVRPYAMIYPFAALTILLAFRVGESWNTNRVVRYALSLALLMNLLPSCIALGSACSCLIAFNIFKDDQPIPKKLIRLLIIGTITTISSCPILIQSYLFSHADTGYQAITSHASVIRALCKYIWEVSAQLLPVLPMIAEYALDDNVPYYLRKWLVWPGAIASAYLLVQLLRPASNSQYSPRLATPQVALLAVATTGILLAGALFDIRMLTAIKTLPVVTIPIIMLFALITSHQPSWILVFAIVAGCRAWTASTHLHGASNGEFSDALRAAVFIQNHSSESDLIVLANPQLAPAFSYYFKGNNEQIHHPYPGPQPHWEFRHQAALAQDPSRVDHTLARMKQALESNHRVWFVHSGHPVPDGRSWWYCPEALTLFMDFLDRNGQVVCTLDAVHANEPFWTILYENKPQ